MKTENNTVLITGGTSGTGVELAKDFLALGNTVVYSALTVSDTHAYAAAWLAGSSANQLASPSRQRKSGGPPPAARVLPAPRSVLRARARSNARCCSHAWPNGGS